jgi:uncharacterized protein DUF2341
MLARFPVGVRRALLPALLLVLTLVAMPGQATKALMGQTATVPANTFQTAPCFTNWWWNTNYLYRRPLTVSTGAAAVGVGYSELVTFNHAALVAAGKSLANGDDVRVVHWNSGACSWTELDRVLGDTAGAWNQAATALWFRLSAAIAANASDGDYYLYYGNPAAAAPPANPKNVFFFWDDFPGAGLGASWAVLRPPAAGWSVGGGRLNINMDPNETFAGNNNTATLFSVAAPAGDFEAQVQQIGRPTLNGQTGSLFDYQNDDNYVGDAHLSTGAESIGYGWEVGGALNGVTVGVNSDPTYLRTRKLGTSYTGWYSTNGGATFTQVGGAVLVNLSPIRVGVSAFSFTNNVGSMSFDNVRIRNLVNPEPTTAVGAEQLKP